MTQDPMHKDLHFQADDTEEYPAGWYFSDECEQMNGPFEDRGTALRTYNNYCEDLYRE